MNAPSLARSWWFPVLGASLIACGAPTEGASEGDIQQMPPIPVLAAVAELRPIQPEVSTVGSLRSSETTTVAADVSGIIVALSAVEGRQIRRGQEIARLDDATAQAALQVAEARHANAAATLERVAPLVRDGVVPQQSLDDAKAEMATAEGLLEEARTQRAKTVITAPFSGLVGIQTAQLGQYINSGDPIVQITKLDPLELVFAVPQEQAGAVRVGQTVEARVGRCGQRFGATVEALDAQIDQQNRTLAVQARVANPERTLIPGMSARVRLAVGEATEALVIPREALVARGSGYVVWTVDPDGSLAQRPVEPQRFLPDVVAINGLEPGARVVAAGQQKLQPGAKVAAEEWQPTDNADLDLGTRGLPGSDADCED